MVRGTAGLTGPKEAQLLGSNPLCSPAHAEAQLGHVTCFSQ